jgi:hypothetical protein
MRLRSHRNRIEDNNHYQLKHTRILRNQRVVPRVGVIQSEPTLLSSKDFQNWANCQDDSRMFWCAGILGASKTVMASLAISHLMSPSVVKAPVAYISTTTGRSRLYWTLYPACTTNSSSEPGTAWFHSTDVQKRISDAGERYDTLIVAEYCALLEHELVRNYPHIIVEH